MSSLAELQKTFSLALLDAQRAESMGAEIAVLFEGSTPQVLNALGIYRGNRISNLLASMRATYPVIQQLVGDDFFEGLVRAYIRQHPSQSGNLHDYGAKLGDFLADFEPARNLAYLSSVAQLEWLVHLAYGDSDDADSDDPVASSALPLAAHSEPVTEPWLKTSGKFYLLESPFPIVSIWQAHQGVSPDLKALESLSSQQSEIALVHRPQNASPTVDRITDVQVVILELAKQEITLEKALEAVAAHLPGQTVTVEDISQQIISLIHRGYLILDLLHNASEGLGAQKADLT